jgi:hypothetical protein
LSIRIGANQQWNHHPKQPNKVTRQRTQPLSAIERIARRLKQFSRNLLFQLRIARIVFMAQFC